MTDPAPHDVARPAPAAVTGLVPAAGRGTRLALAEGSKELVAVPDLDAPDPGAATVPVCEYLLRLYRAAGIERLALVRRAEKRDVAAHFDALRAGGTDVVDLVVEPTPGSAHSLALGCAAVPGATVAAGFPDIVLRPVTLVRDALAKLEETGADLCLANVPIPPAQRPEWDLCELDGDRVTGLVFKPPADPPCELPWGLCLAVWRPAFSRFLVDGLLGADGAPRPEGEGLVAREPGKEVSLGHCLLAGIEAGLDARCVNAPDGFALDVGEPRRLAAAARLRRAPGSESGPDSGRGPDVRG